MYLGTLGTLLLSLWLLLSVWNLPKQRQHILLWLHFFPLFLQTIHRASVDGAEKKFPESECMAPYYKESAVLDFSLAMVRESCLDKDEKNPQLPEESEWGNGDAESNSFTDEDILLVSMTNTSIAIVRARGCNPQNPCSNCGGTGCTLSDIIMATKQSTFASGEG